MESQATMTGARAIRNKVRTDAERDRILEFNHKTPQPEDWLSVCRSEKSLQLLQKAGRYTRAAHPVMIVGEYGTGRRQVARYIHAHSSAKSLQIVRVACGQLTFGESANAVGYESLAALPMDGACSDASFVWLFENVDQVPLELQPPLIGLLEQISATKTERSNPRVISTASTGVFEALECGQLREELFYMLYVLEIDVPPLRQRKQEIPALVEYFSSRLSPSDKQPHRFTPDATSLLSEYHWPGNIIELRNVIAQQCALSERIVVDAQQLSHNWQLRKRVPQLDQETLNLEEAETRIILDALTRCQGNKTATAKKLGITTRTLHNKLNKFRRMGLVA